MKKPKLIKIPIKPYIDFFELNRFIPSSRSEYEHKTRSFEKIEKLIETIYKELANAQMNGYNPTFVMVSYWDFAFLDAYRKYYPQKYSPVEYKSRTDFYVTNEIKVNSVFGLKIIVSNVRKPKVGWEP